MNLLETISPLHLGLLFSSALFCLGLVTALARSNTILVLLGVELMLNAANINFIAFARHSAAGGGAMTGVLFALFSIAVAAAEAAVGLALIIAIYRHRRSVRLQDANELKG
jgi:NADH-quinone oxidoreductase subunit K